VNDLPPGFDSNVPAGAALPEEHSAVARVRSMLRSLLAERFQLSVHHEERELPIYALVVARRTAVLGPRLRKVDVDCAALRASARTVPPAPNQAACGGFRRLGPDRVTGHAVSMAMIAKHLSGTEGRSVVDRTDLAGVFDMDLQWSPDEVSGPSIFTALQEQLGLKFEPSRDRVEVLVIDRAERPHAD
jgi:uncharacterized protein (TIGR03435 family)